MITGTPTNFLQEKKSNSMVLADAKLQVGSFQIKLIRPRSERNENWDNIPGPVHWQLRLKLDADQIAGALNLHDFEVKVNDQWSQQSDLR